MMRWLRPEALLLTAVTGFDDRNMVNQCLLYRYIISYEPYNFKGRLPDMPLTVAYGQKKDALHTELREWLWDHEFRGTKGAVVTDLASGRAHAPFSVFASREDGSLAVVVANYSYEPVFVSVAPEAPGARDGGTRIFDRYRFVEGSGWEDRGDQVPLPPRSAAVVVSLHA